MAFLIDEEKFIEDNIFQYETRLNTQLSRFLDKTPVFTTYYHLNVNESTADEGFIDIESNIGDKSPLRFQKIEKFPIYGLDQIVLALEEQDEGIDTSYNGEAVILPNTIKPLPNDYFTINHLNITILFRVTDISYDTLRADNFYKIGFKINSIDRDVIDKLNNQVKEKYSCILQNIGSEDSCIIKEEYLEQIEKIDELFNDMMNTYKVIFYNERYNCFLGDSGTGYKLYDPLQTVFFNNHGLLNNKNDYSTIVLTEGFNDTKRKIKYEKSIYRVFERRDVKFINTFPYHLVSGITKVDSPFARWNDKSVLITDIPVCSDRSATETLLSEDVVNTFKLNAPTDSKYIELMQKFVRNEPLTIYDIPLDLNEELLYLEANEEVFFFTPILLYIIKTVVTDFLNTKK